MYEHISLINYYAHVDSSTKKKRSATRKSFNEDTKLNPRVCICNGDRSKTYKWYYTRDFWNNNGIFINLEIYSNDDSYGDPEYFSAKFLSPTNLVPSLDLTSGKLKMKNKPLRNCYYGSRGNAYVEFDVEWY